MVPYFGDFLPGTTVRIPFNTFTSAGASVTIATNGTISVYKDAGTTETTTGVTFSEDLDGRTGFHVANIATTDAFYAQGSEFTVVIHGATIDGQSVNAAVGSFSILRDAGRHGILRFGTAAAVAAGTLDLDSGAGFADNEINNHWLMAYGPTQGRWQVRQIDTYTNSTKRCTFVNWHVTPSGSPILFMVLAAPPNGTLLPDVNAANAGVEFLKRFIDLNTTLATSNIVAGSVLALLNTYVQNNLPKAKYRNVVQTVNSQTEMVLTSPASPDAQGYKGDLAIFTDAANAQQKSTGIPIINYVAGTRTITLATVPEFTVVAGDGIVIEAYTRALPAALPGLNTGLPIVDASGLIPGLQTAGIDAFFNKVVEGTTTWIESIRLANAALGGLVSGANSNNPIFRNLANTKNVINSIVDDSGNRLSVTRDLSP